MNLQNILLIGTGSFLGGIARYLLSQAVMLKVNSSFPAGTLLVNLLGCLAIGAVYGIGEKGHITNEWRLFLMTGLCGGFTTFSAFGLETFTLLRDGQNLYAAAYILGSVLLGLCATMAGVWLCR